MSIALSRGNTKTMIAPDLTTLELGFDAPALPGMAESDILTPALIIDLDAFEDNVERLRSLCASHSVRHRAHAKNA
jgi:3-hydroxy-D-aspartate aldolase